MKSKGGLMTRLEFRKQQAEERLIEAKEEIEFAQDKKLKRAKEKLFKAEKDLKKLNWLIGNLNIKGA